MDQEISDARESVLERCVSDCEKTVIIHALRRTKGNPSDAAKILGTTKRYPGPIRSTNMGLIAKNLNKINDKGDLEQ